MLTIDLSGEPERDEPLLSRYSAPVLKRAREALRRGYVHPASAPSTGPNGLVLGWAVKSLNNGKSYAVRVIVDAETGELLGAMCACTHGRNNAAATCYHAAAVALLQ